MAHREQVLEDLWPASNPSSATNSLNQTLYFLRRDIDEWYEDGVSVDYVRFEGDLLWLDPEMVWIASTAFDAAVRRARVSSDDVGKSLGVFEMYPGRWAPEFEYEDWSVSWREHLHARYLQLAQALVARLTADGDLATATRIVTAALRCDGEALELERDLIWIYAHTGSAAAAAEQYRHYAAATRLQLGLEAPHIEDILRCPPGTTELRHATY